MIVILAMARHLRPTYGLRQPGVARIRHLSYERAFLLPFLPRATYIFTDFERMTAWELELAAELYRVAMAKGCRVLNDPARFLPRAVFLQALHRDKLNHFQVWKAYDLEQVDRFPVFLRHEAGHRGVLTELIYNHDELVGEVAAKIDSGVPISDLMIVEYAAQADENGVFRKWSMYRVGDEYVPSAGVFEPHWCAKSGVIGVAGDDTYKAELASVREMHHLERIKEVFSVSGMDFGRVDFGLVDGVPQVYEINTNPTISNLRAAIAKKKHPSPYRLETFAVVLERMNDAVRALDEHNKTYFFVNATMLNRCKKNRIRRPFTRSMP